MDLILQRDRYESDGIFSRVTRADTGAQVCVTLDHAYPSGLPQYKYLPKVLPGRYLCKRRKARLKSSKAAFETFEVTGVKGHTGILFHAGNWNEDSEGCFLTGDKVLVTSQDRDGVDGPDELVSNTRVAFQRFMELQGDAQEFWLEVRA